MPFKGRPNDYQIEEATSDRAKCRRCNKKIGKGALRLRIVAFVCPGRSTAFFRCAECVDPKLAAAVLNVCGAAGRQRWSGNCGWRCAGRGTIFARGGTTTH